MTETTLNPIRMVRDAAISVKGNARACIMAEPVFAIAHNLYAGYMTLYMLELGLTSTQVGLVTSLGLSVHILFSFISAYITDKLGRKNTTLIFDLIGWIGAQIVWALARNIWFFIAGAIINAFFRVVMNSWQCLMLEDSEPEVRVHIFSFLQVAGIVAGFFAPVGALLIKNITLIPAMRIMVAFANIPMIACITLRHRFVTETAAGLKRMQETKDLKMRESFQAYLPVLLRIAKDRVLIIALLLRSLNLIQLTIRSTFLAVLVTERLGFPAEIMATFHTVNSVVMLMALLFIMPMLSRFTSRWPISMGICFHLTATAVFLLSPPTKNYLLLMIGAILIALGTSIATPRIDAIVANSIANEDRSLVNAVIAVISLTISMPFGYIGGVLSGIDARLPFLLTLLVFLLCLLLLRAARLNGKPGTAPE